MVRNLTRLINVASHLALHPIKLFVDGLRYTFHCISIFMVCIHCITFPMWVPFSNNLNATRNTLPISAGNATNEGRIQVVIIHPQWIGIWRAGCWWCHSRWGGVDFWNGIVESKGWLCQAWIKFGLEMVFLWTWFVFLERWLFCRTVNIQMNYALPHVAHC